MRGLVEPDCGGVNPLVRLTNRYTADRARVAEGVSSTTSREAVGEGGVSSQGLVRLNSFWLLPFLPAPQGSGVLGGDSGGGCEANSHFQDGLPPL